MSYCRTNPLPLLALLGFTILPLIARAADNADDKKKPEVVKEKDPEENPKAKRPTLADRIPPVSGNLFLKSGRTELTPAVGMSLSDAFFQKYSLGLKASYHFAETFSAGLYGSYSLTFARSGLSKCTNGSCEQATTKELEGLPGRISAMAGLDLAWSPLYGKINIFAEKVIHFDMAFIIGADLIRHQVLDQNSLKDTFTPGGHLGLGQRIFLSPDVTLRLELRDYLYMAKVQLNNSSNKLQNQLMFELGVSFFLGGGPKE